MPDGSLRAALANTPFCYESHARVRAPADGGTSTRSHGVAPAQECRLRLKRPPPKAAPWFPPTSEVVRQVVQTEKFRFSRA
jgi:hypothetical protein